MGAMDKLSEGTPLSWTETKQYAKYVRENGIQQFINHYLKYRTREGDRLKWGDEVSEILEEHILFDLLIYLFNFIVDSGLCYRYVWLITYSPSSQM